VDAQTIDPGVVEFAADDIEDFEALYGELCGMPGVEVAAVSSSIAEGEQGAVLEFLTVACSGGAVSALLQLLTALVESRGPRFTATRRSPPARRHRLRDCDG
jgi:hypothetical protein